MRLEIFKSAPSLTGKMGEVVYPNRRYTCRDLLVKWERWFIQIVDIHVVNFNMKLTGRWFPQIVDRDSGNLYPIYT